MTATVITTNSMSEIILIPDNEFEKSLIEGFENEYNIDVDTRFKTESTYGVKNKHKIHIFITKNQDK